MPTYTTLPALVKQCSGFLRRLKVGVSLLVRKQREWFNRKTCRRWQRRRCCTLEFAERVLHCDLPRIAERTFGGIRLLERERHRSSRTWLSPWTNNRQQLIQRRRALRSLKLPSTTRRILRTG